MCGPVTLTGDIEHARNVAVNSSHVYFTDGSYRIRRVPLTGGQPEDISNTLYWPGGIAIDSTHVYWTEAQMSGSRVMRALLGGGSKQTLADFQARAHDVVVDETFVYFTTPEDGSVRRIPLGGGTNEVVLGGQNEPLSLEIMDGKLYFTETWAFRARHMAVNGTNLQSYATSALVPRSVTVHSSAVLWTERDFNNDFDGRVVQAPVDGGPSTVLASGQPRPHTAATDGTTVYFTCSADKGIGNGSVRMVALTGGTVRVLSDDEYAPRDIVVQGDAIYYGTGNAIRKIVR